MTSDTETFVRFGRECHRVLESLADGTVRTRKVPPPRRLRVPVFGAGPVPFGRRVDVLRALGDRPDGALAWVDANPRDVFGGAYLYRFACPLALRIARETGSNRYTPAYPSATYPREATS